MESKGLVRRLHLAHCLILLFAFNAAFAQPSKLYLSKARKLWNENNDSSLYYSKLALQAAMLEADDSLTAESYSAIGVGHLYTADYYNARINFEKSRQRFQALKLRKRVADIDNNIALIYEIVGLDSLAEMWHRKSLKARTELKDSFGIAASLSNIGVLRFNQADYVTAMQLFEQAQLIDSKMHDSLGIAYELNNIGLIDLRNQRYEKALMNFQHSSKIKARFLDSRGLLESMLNEAFAQIGLGKTNLAQQQLPAIDSLSNLTGDKSVIPKIVRLRALLHSKKGHFEKALEMFDASENIKDSLQNADVIRKLLIIEMDSLMISVKQEAAIKDNLYNEEKKKGSYAWIIVCLSLLAFAILLGAAWWYRQRMKKKLLQLSDHNAHQTRGPLATILGLFYLIERYPTSEEEKQQYLEQIKDKAKEVDNATRELSKKLNDEL